MKHLLLLAALIMLCSCSSWRKVKRWQTSEHTADTTSVSILADFDHRHSNEEQIGIKEETVVVVERRDGDSLKVETKTTTVKTINSVRTVRDTVTVCVRDTVWRTHEVKNETVNEKIQERKERGYSQLVSGIVAAVLLVLLLIIRKTFKWN